MIREQDLRIDVYRSGAVSFGITDPWGVWVRITHIPSGISGTGRDVNSSFKARDAAIRDLLPKLRASGRNWSFQETEGSSNLSQALQEAVWEFEQQEEE